MSGEGPSQGPAILNYQLINNQRGLTLLHAGHAYNLHRNNKFSEVWVCKNKKSKKCGGSVKLNKQVNSVQIQIKHIQECVPDFSKNELNVVLDKIKEEVCNNYCSVQKIYETGVLALKNKIPDEDVPSFNSVKDTLYRKRRRDLKVPKTCFKKATDVIVPEKFQPFVLIDYSENENRIIVFCSEKALGDVKNIKHYLCDGTFDSCPIPFKQIFTLHGDIGKDADGTNIVPIFYVLLVNKETSTYEIMFSKIKEVLPDFEPTKFTVDFETATMKAINKIFPQAETHGCYVHFQRSVYRKAQSLKLLDNEETTNYVKMCVSLAFLPEEDIEDGWLVVMENGFSEENITKFNDYFVAQWLEPHGMISKWCCFEERHRSTNLVEAWNHRLQRHLGRKPSLISFYEMITIDSFKYDTAKARLQSKNRAVSKPQKRTIANNKSISSLTDQYKKNKKSISEFLEEISSFVVIRQKKH